MERSFWEPLLVYMFAPGAAGGIASFLIAVKMEHYRNNKYLIKFGIEVMGGSITAGCLAYLLRDSQHVFVFAFLIGTAWSHILQKIRTKVTKLVEVALGDAGRGGQ